MIVGAQPTSGQRFVTSTDWNGYLSVLEAFKDRRIKITYDEGALELLSPSTKHELVKKLVASIVEFTCFERGVSYVGGGSTTFRRKILDKGLEPDECFYFENRHLVGSDDEDTEYPEPDLAIEVEVTQSAINRLGIFHALGVREVWRYTSKDKLLFLRLGPQGYVETDRSSFLPFLSADDIVRFVQRGLEIRDNTKLWRELRAWLLEQP